MEPRRSRSGKKSRPTSVTEHPRLSPKPSRRQQAVQTPSTSGEFRPVTPEMIFHSGPTVHIPNLDMSKVRACSSGKQVELTANEQMVMGFVNFVRGIPGPSYGTTVGGLALSPTYSLPDFLDPPDVRVLKGKVDSDGGSEAASDNDEEGVVPDVLIRSSNSVGLTNDDVNDQEDVPLRQAKAKTYNVCKTSGEDMVAGGSKKQVRPKTASARFSSDTCKDHQNENVEEQSICSSDTSLDLSELSSRAASESSMMPRTLDMVMGTRSSVNYCLDKTTLKLLNLNGSTKKRDIQQIFHNSVAISKPGSELDELNHQLVRVAYVKFHSAGEALEALETMQGIRIDGNRVRLEFHREYSPPQ